MATIISTKTSGVGGLEVTGDATGILQLASNNGTTAVTIDASQNVSIAGTTTISKGTTGTLAVQSSGTSGTYPSTGAGFEFVAGSASGQDSLLTYNRTSSAWRDLYIQSNNMLFGTNGTERMRIDSSGRVTMPYQPSFHATHSNGSLSTGEIVWGNIVYNIGSYYNSSNGRFTAPVSGTYYFCALTLIQNAPAGEVRMAIYKNGSGYGGLRFITIKPANSWWSIIAEGHVYMTAGDYVSIFMELNPTTLYNDANYNSFSGNFIG